MFSRQPDGRPQKVPVQERFDNKTRTVCIEISIPVFRSIATVEFKREHCSTTSIQAAPRPKHLLNSLFFTFSRIYSHGFLRYPRHLFHLHLWLQ
ncbi:hypothetical protein K443DRAFT_518819 [Laccaria amethystina LaAM-08-1]|uniref:Uncharacterized protein n=1 Tax=Laccaria amethystina LaAM-08-1 TaxID=1095629 RepID=A0A0C9WM24_9AGAR|nr:hypothetical protein K443DRAFT_518819 [Laccaria amethystina LaAM-08-1]